MRIARLPWLLWLVLAVPAWGGEGPSPARPNVLWLIAEDLGPHLGCCGTKEVRTPNLDRLAAEGVRYARFYATAPVCSPSRSAFMTGMYATTIGAHHHRSHRDDGFGLPEGVRVLTDWLRDAGYFTANVRVLPKELGFQGTGKTDWNFRYDGKPFDSDNWDDLKSHQPFYAQVNFQETHRRFSQPADPLQRADPAKVEIPPYYPDHSLTRSDWAGYLDAASALDEKVGKILRRLEADGLAESTIVVFFGDNGQAHVRGKQWCYESGLHVPLIVRWPKQSLPPRHFKPGTVDDRLLAAIDLAPTMLDMAGVKRPAKMEGESFLGDRAGPPRRYVFGARDRCDETIARLRTVRDERYRYLRNFMPERPFLQPNRYKETQYPVWNLLKQLHAEGKLTTVQEFLVQPTMPSEELYDLEKDPHEICNLVGSGDPLHQAALARLRGVLEKWIVATGDQGRIAEPPEVAAAQGATRPAAKARSKPPAAHGPGKTVLRFGLVADVQYADKPDQGPRHHRKSADKLKSAVADWSRQDLAFVVSLGDVIDGHGPASADELRSVVKLLEPLKAPVHHVIGNHCLEVDRKTLLDVLGLKSSCYDFSHGDWRFIVLDGMDVSVKSPQGSEELARAREYLARNPKLPKYNGAIGPKQLAWLKERLSEAKRLGQKAIVFCHHPVLPESSSPANVLWNHKEVLAALTDSGCVVAYFCGHEHSGGYAVRSGIHHVTVPGMVESPDDSTGCAVVELRPDRLGIQGLGTVPSRVLKMKALDSRPSM